MKIILYFDNILLLIRITMQNISLLFIVLGFTFILSCSLTVSPSRISHLPWRRMKTYRSRVPAARRISRYPGYIRRPSYSLAKQARFYTHINARLETALPFVIVRYRVHGATHLEESRQNLFSFILIYELMLLYATDNRVRVPYRFKKIVKKIIYI